MGVARRGARGGSTRCARSGRANAQLYEPAALPFTTGGPELDLCDYATWQSLYSCSPSVALDAAVHAAHASKTSRPPAPELLGLTVGRDCHRLRAGPRRLTLGLQRLHWNVLLWDVPGCRIRAAALVRKQRAANFPIRPSALASGRIRLAK